MASEVKTNKVSPSTGTTLSVGDSGDTLALAVDAVTGLKVGSDAAGDVLYNDGTDYTRLAKPGTPADEVLTFATGASAPSWVAASAAGGKVLQVLTVTNASVIHTSSTSFVTTGVTLTITPAATTSKIFIMLQGGGAYPTATASVTMRTTVYRGAVDLGSGTVGITRHTTPGGSHQITPHSIAHLDSPSTTSATVYTVYFKNADTAGTVQFNDTDRGLISFTLMEIGA